MDQCLLALTMKTFHLSLTAIVTVGVDAGAGASAVCFPRPQDMLLLLASFRLFASFDSTTKTGRQSLTGVEVFTLTHVHAACD